MTPKICLKILILNLINLFQQKLLHFKIKKWLQFHVVKHTLWLLQIAAIFIVLELMVVDSLVNFAVNMRNAVEIALKISFSQRCRT